MYTDEDLACLKEDYRKIERYIKEHYVPRLVGNEIVGVSHATCDYLDYDGDCWLQFSKDFIRVSCAHKTFSFGGEPGLLDIYQCPFGAEALVFSWKDLKRKIEIVLNGREARRHAIRNFQVE